MNPAGGQFSSLYDLARLMQMFIDPTRPESLLRPYTVREWLRPIHAFWDDYSKMGMLWEISSVVNSHGRKVDLYEKGAQITRGAAFPRINSVPSIRTPFLQPAN